MNFLNQQSITVESLDCVLKGSGVEPISGCFGEDLNHGPYYMLKRMTKKEPFILNSRLLMGANVKLKITFKNIHQFGGSYEASYFLNEALQEKMTILDGKEHSFVINNYLFENDGYLKLMIDKGTADYIYHLIITCEAN